MLRGRRGVPALLAMNGGRLLLINRPPLPLQVTFVLTCLLLVLVSAAYVFTRSRPVYLLNFRCFKPPAK